MQQQGCVLRGYLQQNMLRTLQVSAQFAAPRVLRPTSSCLQRYEGLGHLPVLDLLIHNIRRRRRRRDFRSRHRLHHRLVS